MVGNPQKRGARERQEGADETAWAFSVGKNPDFPPPLLVWTAPLRRCALLRGSASESRRGGEETAETPLPPLEEEEGRSAMAASERIQNRRNQCIFRLAFQHCPLRKLARKIRGKNTYNVPAEPSESFSNHWRSFSTISGNLSPHERSGFNQMAGDSAHPLPQASIQTLPQGSQPPAFPLHQVQVELNREPSVSSMDMEVDPETGERAQS